MRLLLTTALVTSLSFPALAGEVNSELSQAVAHSNVVSVPSREVAQDTNPPENLKPRVELNHRYSNDRAITMSEFWVPLAQNAQDGSVLFGDVRLMGDNNDNQEFNIGAGYREIVDAKILGEGIVGGMVWFDKRSTARGSDFNQVTAGAEWLGEKWDIRANGYVPFNDSKAHTQANTNGAGAGFVGNQLLVNTDQTVVEESMMGADLEVGYKLHFLDGVTDATRVYGGAYHFEGDRAEDVSGWRARVASDVTSDIQVGARYQHDDVRGSQTYLEATVRFPFKAKKSFQKEGLRSRLDEAPERDIDIVSNEAVVDAGTINATLLNAQTGLAQNIIHVDNTNGAGTGTAADPFNTLAAAQAAAGVNDMIYVHRGDGTTTGQANGITLDDAGQMLAGSGADLMFSRDRFRTSDGKGVSQPVIKATAAPIITNGAGDGVRVTGDSVYVSGITVDGASVSGVYVVNADRAVIENIKALNSGLNGIRGQFTDGTEHSLTVRNSNFMNNGSNGIVILVISNSRANIMVRDNVVKNNGGHGIYVTARGTSSVTASILGNYVGNNFDEGVRVEAYQYGRLSALIADNISELNGGSPNSAGFLVFADDDAYVNALLTRNTAKNGEDVGFWFLARDNASVAAAMNDNVSIGNTNAEIKVNDESSGGIDLNMYNGQNSIVNNQSVNPLVVLDLDGETLDARGNWWGRSSGISSSEVLLVDDSRINASNPLHYDPNR